MTAVETARRANPSFDVGHAETKPKLNNWATFLGNQDDGQGGVIPLFNLTRDIPGHPAGSTIAQATLEAAIGVEADAK